MKKKGLAIFALAAVMSLGAMGITAFAAGWSQEGSNWVYYNNNGSKVTNAWRQAQDGTWALSGKQRSHGNQQMGR